MTDQEKEAKFHSQLDEFLETDRKRARRREAIAVSPKMELVRSFDGMIVLARGGRQAGAKTSGFISLLVQETTKDLHRVACLRETQASLEESVYHEVQAIVDRLEYPGWRFPKSQNYCESPIGSRWIFRGLKDSQSNSNSKGLSKFTRFFIDEAAFISAPSWDVILPTLFRNKGAKLYAAYNPETDSDPVELKLWNPFKDSDDALLLDMLPEEQDNPWFNEESKKLSAMMKRDDPDLWEHVYGGQPMKQGDRSVMSRVDVREAMDRVFEPGPTGSPEEIGIDVARFGDDKTTFFHRRGMQVVEWREVSKMDTQEVARIAWDMAGRNPSVLIKVDDSGVGGGVTDKLNDLGAKVLPVNFGGLPQDETMYTSVADEMWFTFPIKEAFIPDNPELLQELSGRQFEYTRKEQRKIEPKDVFKKRIGRSPDKADGLLLCFYSPKKPSFSFAF